MDFLAVTSGLAVCAIVGINGVGGASLMTPPGMGAFKLHPALAVACRKAWHVLGLRLERRRSPQLGDALTVAAGARLGVMVSLSSVGAGLKVLN